MTHERIHTGIIKFECKICDFRCNRYIQMENHKKVGEYLLKRHAMMLDFLLLRYARRLEAFPIGIVDLSTSFSFC